MGGITNQEKTIIKKMVRKTRLKTDPLARALVAKLPKDQQHPDMIKAIAAQNVLSDCMTAAFEELAPFEDVFCLEMAIRLASYAISMVPIERQELLLTAVVARLGEAHDRRLKAGIVMSTTWMGDDGIPHKNVPDKGDLN